MDIPNPPKLEVSQSKIRAGCKIVIVAGKIEEGYCIMGNELEEGPIGYYRLPGTNLLIDSVAYGLFKHPAINAFIAIKKSGSDVYTLQALRKEDAERYKRGELSSREIEVEYIPPLSVSQSGSFGSVEFFPTEGIALKTSISKTYYGDIPEDMVKEIAIYRLLKNISCLPEFYDFQIDGDAVKLQFELGTVLSEVIIDKFEEMRTVMFRLAKCLRASASQGVIHCDLKPNNIVISPDGSVKIIDWGIAEIDQSKDQMREKFTNKQTLKWRSPELILDASETQYSYKIDVFSLGLIFLGIFIKSDAVFTAQTLTDYKKLLLTKLLGLNGKNLKTDSQIDEIIREIIQNNTINAPIIAKNLMTNRQFYTEGKPSKIPEDLADLISKMLEFSPTIRASYDEVILHPFFQKMNRESIPKLPRYINNMPIIEDITETWKPVFAENARLVLFRWLKSLSQRFKLTFDTLCLSFQLLDLLVIRDPTFIRKDNAQTCASVCALLASKLYDIYPSEIEDISYYTDGGSSIQQIKELEREILVLFNGNLIVPSFYTYYSHINGAKKDPKNYEILYSFYLTPDVYKIPFVEKVDSIELL